MIVGGRNFIEVFRLRYEMIRALEGPELVAALRNWFLWLRETQPTAELLGELTAEGGAAVAEYGRLCSRIRALLHECAVEVSALTPDIETGIAERRAGPELLEGDRDLIAAMEELGEQSREPALPSSWTQFPQSPDGAFVHLRKRAEASQALTDRVERQGLIKRVQDAQWEAQRQFSTAMLPLAGLGIHAHAAFQFLMGCLGVPGDRVPVQHFGWPSVDPVAAIQDTLFGPREVAPNTGVQPEQIFPRGIQEWEPHFRAHAEGLFRELLFRLSARRHLDTTLLRYGRRAEHYDRDRLRGLVEANPSRVEAVLASDCATYLFDCGFDALTEVVLGNVRADIVAPDLYVEAKQVASQAEAKRKVLGAYKQALGSARRLRDRPAGIPPIALVVFLVDGSRIEAPHVVSAWMSSPAVNLYFVDVRKKGQGAAEGDPVKITDDEFKTVATETETGP